MMKRNESLNLLKIISIWFVVGMHFLSHSGYIMNALDLFHMEANMVWLVRSFIMVAVNCFILITGYFQSEKEDIKPAKCFKIMDKMLFYSVSISIILMVVLHKKLTIIQVLYTILPFSTKSYWYMTCYIVVYLISPYINSAVGRLNIKEMRNVLLVAIVLFSVIPTIFNSICSTMDDTNGFGIIWFVILYLTGYWLRKSDFHFRRRIIAPGLYIGCCLLTFIVSVLMNWVGVNVYSGFRGYAISSIGYNYLSVYIASIALFLTFLQLSIPQKITRFINSVASCTGGVYLIHEQPILRDILFTEILGCDRYINDWKWMGCFLLVTVGIVAFCVLIEMGCKKFVAEKLQIIERLASLTFGRFKNN